MAYRDPRFEQHFTDHFVQIPVSKGDVAFFNPALFHAAGDNRTSDVLRMDNLMQVSSVFGKPMENIDTIGITKRCYPHLQALHAEQGFSPDVEALMTMVTDGYPFPGNLDSTPPTGGLAPPSQLDLLRQALAEHWPASRLAAAFDQHVLDRQP